MNSIKTQLTLVMLLMMSFLSDAQISVNNSSLQFQPTNELGKDSLNLTISNQGNQAVNCRIITLGIYGHHPYWTPDSVFSLAAGSQRVVKVYFNPIHNIPNNSELIVLNNSGFGAVKVDLQGQGLYSRAYYDTSRNLEGEALRDALSWRTGTPYTQLGYSGTNNARLRMFGIIDNWKLNGREPGHSNDYKNECVYTGRTISYTAASFNTGTLNNAPFQMNTEHTWPQSFGASSEPMQSDLHHLYITDGPTNSARGNKPFGWVPNPTLNYTGGSKANTTTFEPRDEHKAGVAVAMLYFSVRYKNQSNVTHTYMTSNMENDLREWLRIFPPDSLLHKRNDDIQSFQQNRNPFIDYPQLLDRMSQVRAVASVPEITGILLSDSTINFGAVNQGTQATYRLVLANTGTQLISLSNIQLTGSAFSYSGPSNLQINRGDAVVLEVEHTGTGQSHSGELRFNTNIPAQNLISIPIAAGAGATSMSPFALLAPFSGLTYTIEGDSNQQINFRWQRSVSNAPGAVNYSLRIYPINNPSQIIFERNNLLDTLLSVNYGRLAAALTTYGLSHNQLLGCRWQVEADAGSVSALSTNENNISFRKGVVTSIDELQQRFRLYPNPARDYIVLDSELIGHNTQIEIRDALGRKQHCEAQLEVNQARINTSGLAAGVYFAYIGHEGRQQMASFVISR